MSIVEKKPSATKPVKTKLAKPDKAFAKLGAFEAVPFATVSKRVGKLLAPKKLGKDIYWEDGQLPEIAFVHHGDVRGVDLKVSASQPGVYVIEGDLSSASYLNFDCHEDVIVVVAGNVTTTHLRINFATTLLVEGGLVADHVVSEAQTKVAVMGTTTAKRIFIYEDDTDHRFGKQPRGVVVMPHQLDDVIGDKDGIAYEASVLFRKMVTGKKFLSAAG